MRDDHGNIEVHASAGHGLVDSANRFDLPDETFADTEPDLERRRCRTSTGTNIHPDTALRAAISGRVRRVVVDAARVVIDMGRRGKHVNRIPTRRATNGRIDVLRPDGSPVLPVGAREPDWAEPPPTTLRDAS